MFVNPSCGVVRFENRRLKSAFVEMQLIFFECICLMFDFYIFREISDPSVCCV